MSIKVTRKDNTSKFFGLVVNKTVFFTAIAVIIFSVGFTLVFKEQADHYFGIAQSYVSEHGGGFIGNGCHLLNYVSFLSKVWGMEHIYFIHNIKHYKLDSLKAVQKKI